MNSTSITEPFSHPFTHRGGGASDDEPEHQDHESTGERALFQQEFKEDLGWDGNGDAENPKNWSLTSKAFATFIPAGCTFLVSFSASVYVPGIPNIVREFDVSQTVALLGLTLYVMGLGLGPMIGAPMSETRGRIAVFRFSILAFALFTLGCALASKPSILLLCRLFAGIFGSPALAVGGGSVHDIWDLEQSAGTAGNAFLVMAFLGPALGPLVGGFVVQYKGWRWTMWTSLIITAPVLLCLIPAKETYKKTILERRRRKLGLPLPPKPSARDGLEKLFMVTLRRPMHMMVSETIVIFTAAYNAFLFAILFLFFEAIPYVMYRVYHFSLSEIGCCFGAIAIGVILAGVTFFICDRTLYQTARQRSIDQNRAISPEERLYAAMLGSLLVAIGLFWFAWYAREDLHWATPLVGVVLFSWGMVCIYLSTVAYMFDIYDQLTSASALAANSMSRYVLGAIFPLFTVQMYDKLGRQWAGSVLGFFAVVLMPLPFIMYRYGSDMRAKSKYTNSNVVPPRLESLH